ncbi:MAG: hypothetical protein WC975_02380 [Phycisphaerae bacterium]
MDNRIIQKKLQLLQEIANTSTFPLESWRVRTAEFLEPSQYTYIVLQYMVVRQVLEFVLA